MAIYRRIVWWFHFQICTLNPQKRFFQPKLCLVRSSFSLLIQIIQIQTCLIIINNKKYVYMPIGFIVLAVLLIQSRSCHGDCQVTCSLLLAHNFIFFRDWIPLRKPLLCWSKPANLLVFKSPFLHVTYGSKSKSAAMLLEHGKIMQNPSNSTVLLTPKNAFWLTQRSPFWWNPNHPNHPGARCHPGAVGCREQSLSRVAFPCGRRGALSGMALGSTWQVDGVRWIRFWCSMFKWSNFQIFKYIRF